MSEVEGKVEKITRDDLLDEIEAGLLRRAQQAPTPYHWHASLLNPAAVAIASLRRDRKQDATTLASLQSKLEEKDREIERLKAVIRAFEGGLVDRPPLSRPALPQGETNG